MLCYFVQCNRWCGRLKGDVLACKTLVMICEVPSFALMTACDNKLSRSHSSRASRHSYSFLWFFEDGLKGRASVDDVGDWGIFHEYFWHQIDVIIEVVHCLENWWYARDEIGCIVDNLLAISEFIEIESGDALVHLIPCAGTRCFCNVAFDTFINVV